MTYVLECEVLLTVPGLDVLENLVSSFALVEPRVSAVSHQLTPLDPSLQQEALKGVAAQKPELLQTQQSCAMFKKKKVYSTLVRVPRQYFYSRC